MSTFKRNRHNVPVVMQMEATECGAASLTMILAYYGRWMPLSQMRYECGVSRDGSSMKNIASAARNFGLVPHAYKIEPQDLNELTLPCICHWEFNHFIVITGVSGDTVYINDPARGRLKMPISEFDRGMTGVVMAFDVGPDFVKGGHQDSVLSFAKQRLQGAGEAMAFTFITGLIMAACGIVMPILTQIFADDILSRRNPDWFKPFMCAFCGLIALQVILQLVVGIYQRAFNMKLAVIGNSKYLWHVLHLPMRFFTQRSAGDILMRMGSAQSIASSLVTQFAPMVTNVLLLVLYLYFMIAYSLPLTSIAILMVALNLLFVNLIARKQVDMSRVAQRNSAKLYSIQTASMGCIETIKAAGAEQAFLKRWAGFFATDYNARVEMHRTMAYYGTIPAILSTIGNTAVLAIGVYYILAGELTVGMLMAFQSYMGSFMSPVGQIIGTFSNLLTMRTDMERMEDVYRAEKDPAVVPHPEAKRMGGKLSGELELRHVSFGYNRLSEPLIKDFSLHLKPGQSVALVGGSGCGKSTLAKVIAGLQQPWSGELLYDGHRIEEISREVFTSSLAVIDQDITLFEGTVADNVKMWDGTMEDFAMILACHQAQIHEEIASRQEAYGSRVVENGSNFSGGQRQRLEIATALVREPQILIMDEATSALDAVTEEKIMQTIRMMGITLVIVAHRLSTIRDCDEIIVMDKGEVVERGTHDELLAKDGYYKELVNA